MVAWSPTLEASRAVREARALIAAAEAVHVVMVDPDAAGAMSGSASAAEIAAYLARHCAEVTVANVPSGGNDVAYVLGRHARNVSADLIVMGAYGHSRFREWLFGRVTKSMTEVPPLPLFLAR